MILGQRLVENYYKFLSFSEDYANITNLSDNSKNLFPGLVTLFEFLPVEVVQSKKEFLNMDSNIEIIIINYLSGSASVKDIEFLKNWLSQSEQNKRLFDEMSDVWNATHPHDKHAFDVETAYDKVQQQLWRKDFQIDYQKRLRPYKIAVSIAALLIICMAIVTLMINLKNRAGHSIYDTSVTEIVSPMGSKSQIMLPDGTKVWLNAGSKLRYNAAFSHDNRMIQLEGEAYFDVTKNKQLPFQVSTSNDITIKVLGTAFDLKAYPNEGSIETTLERGSLIVEQNSSGKVTQTILAPKQRAIFIKHSGELFLSDNEAKILKKDQIKSVDQIKGMVLVSKEIETEEYTAWKDNRLVFRNEPFESLTVKLERWYGVKINIADNRIKAYHFNGTIENETINDVMELICFTLPVHYTIQHNTITITK